VKASGRGTGSQYGAATLVLVVAATVVSCGAGKKALSDSAKPPAAALVRTCRTHVEGCLPDGWHGDSVVAGPLAFAGARTFAGYENPDPKVTFSDEKTLVVVEAGRSATVVVPREARRDVALDYDYGGGAARRRTPLVKISDGLPSVRFSACKRGTKPWSRGHPLDRETQFNGGIIGRWGRCLPLDVYAERGAPIRATISFGAGRCGERRR
jgi:hypothetical protein